MSCYKLTYTNVDTRRALDALHVMPKCFVPTGSRAYGGHTESSDYDFVVNPKATWLRGDILTGLLLSWSRDGGPQVTRTEIVAANDTYEFGAEVLVERVEPDKLPDIEVVYIQGQHNINLIFCESPQEFESWLEATDVMKQLRGRDKERVQVKEARVLAFRVLRRSILQHKR